MYNSNLLKHLVLPLGFILQVETIFFLLFLQLLYMRNLQCDLVAKAGSRSLSQMPCSVRSYSMATALYQINPYRVWHCHWEKTDLWASGIPVLECIYLLLFPVRLLCPLASCTFTLHLLFPQAPQKNHFLRQNSVRYVIFVQKQTTAHFSHPFAISRVSQDPLTVLLWTSKSLLVFRWLWLSAFVSWLHFFICWILDRNMDSVCYTTFNHKWNFTVLKPDNFTWPRHQFPFQVETVFIILRAAIWTIFSKFVLFFCWSILLAGIIPKWEILGFSHSELYTLPICPPRLWFAEFSFSSKTVNMFSSASHFWKFLSHCRGLTQAGS